MPDDIRENKYKALEARLQALEIAVNAILKGIKEIEKFEGEEFMEPGQYLEVKFD